MPHLDAAFSLARFLMRNEDDARDVVQEAALRAFRFYESFRGENSRAWFLSIVRNACFTALKRKRADETHVEFDEELHGAAGPPVDPGKEIDRELDRQTVRAAIEQCRPNSAKSSSCASWRNVPTKKSPISPASPSVPSCRGWSGPANSFTKFFAKATSAKSNS